MPTQDNTPLKGLEEAEAAYRRVEAEAMALKEEELSPMNVDIVGATSVILGALAGILALHDRIAKLPEFEIRHVEQLENRAKAAWFAYVTNLPEPEPKDFQEMLEECRVLRTVMLKWADPLVFSGKFDQASIDKIKEGSGNKDIPSDVVALVALYRSKWDEIKNMCGVTEAQLDRGAAIAPVVFATIARRENRGAPSQSGGSVRVRRFWTLADRSYDQCRRAVHYLYWGTDEAAKLTPSLRRNAGVRPAVQEEPAQPAAPATPAQPAAPAGPAVGGASDPFVRG